MNFLTIDRQHIPWYVISEKGDDVENQLKEVRFWATRQIALQQEPPYEFRRLIQTIDAILENHLPSIRTPQTRSLRPPGMRQLHRPGTHLRLVDASYRADA